MKKNYVRTFALSDKGTKAIPAIAMLIPLGFVGLGGWFILLWQDLNGNGISEEGELFTLADMGITSINLDATYINQWSSGNWLSHESTFTWANGDSGQIIDAGFENSTLHTRYRPGEDVTRKSVENHKSARCSSLTRCRRPTAVVRAGRGAQSRTAIPVARHRPIRSNSRMQNAAGETTEPVASSPDHVVYVRHRLSAPDQSNLASWD